MDSRSLWVATAQAPDRSAALPSKADVVVLGAGIAGLTTAYLLAEAGRTVTVIEADRVAAGVSGHTTAKLTSQHGLRYDQLTRSKGRAAAASYGASQLAALEWVLRVAAEQGIECALERVDSYVYSTRPDQRDTLRAEAEAALNAGLPASYVDMVDIPVSAVGAVRFADQAQFHPRQWLLGLAALVESRGGRIVEGVRATNVTEANPMRVHTTAGTIQAEAVVVTTHYPILDRGVFFARLEPTRDLVVAGPAPKEVTGTYLDADTHYSVRAATAGGRRYFVVGGEAYRVGARLDVNAKYEKLAEWAATHLGLTSITHRWSAHDMSTLDGVPYVGRYHPGAKRLFVATGFGQWGMTGGTAAGLLLRDLVLGEKNDLASLYDPNRVSLRSVPSFVSANATVAKHLAGDHARALRSADASTLEPGSARVARRGAAMVASYRDETGELHEVSARCTHLGCLVAFNNAERSWDCPCHGSRFGVDGSVLQGPAVRPLKKITDEKS
ncbi:FAD-dependent oxidoreductase [Actinophytocola xanthii]|uniref:(2Fe-2S)-binding protein n=1 Tax=Actinophytocola xanthii TaxID=1912961 RepID=A0A1Q8CGW1_9PSEU|nr:FAD-dependent oxidoreductase [Actinophytocola xanthii]OLF13552.1 (2Fe-2S)-binding protein [Actinophytocola xanthii]